MFSFVFVFPFFFSGPYRDTVISISEPNIARYESGAQLYTITSSILYIIAGIVFYTSNRIFRQKKSYFIFLLMFIALNIGILVFSAFASKDAVHEKMHIYILFMLLSFLLKSTPFYEKKDVILSAANILRGIDETVVILDKQGKTAYIHNSFKNIDISLHIDEVTELIEKKNRIPVRFNNDAHTEAEFCFEGEITMVYGRTVHFHYKLSPLFYKKVYIGKIVVLRDITAYTELIDELNEKNVLLKEAFEKQKEHIHIIRRLISEEERARILKMVNNIAGKYLNSLKSQIDRLEVKVETGSIPKEGIIRENEEMLELTRKAIDEIRKTVKQLYIKMEQKGDYYD